MDTNCVRELRGHAASICRKQGWIDESGQVVAPGVGIVDPADLGVQAPMQLHPAFDSIRQSPKLWPVIEEIVDGPLKDRHGDVWRIVFPDGPDLTTPPHCDAQFSREPDREFWTAWIPLEDCPVELGPLEVQNRNGDWVSQPMREGDALLIHSKTMHRAMDNRSVGRLRLSVDLRYARANGAGHCRTSE